MAPVDYTGRADSYRRARTLPGDVLATWRTAVARLGPTRVDLALDVGAGPGGFLDPLSAWFDAPVVAIEPSKAMRDEATAAGVAGRFSYVAGVAEHLPLGAQSIDLAWLSTVFHQFDDPEMAASELHRVARPGGRVLVRGFLSDVPITGLLAAFPGIDRAAGTFPSTEELVRCFDRAGFELAALEDVVEPWRVDLSIWPDRIRSIRHADSALRPLTDAEIEDGIRVVVETYRGVPGRIPSDGTLRLVSFRR